MLSSVLMVAKAGAENFLTSGVENKMSDRSTLSKLKLMARFIPVFMLTATFRIGTIAVCWAWDSNVIPPPSLLPLALILPLVVIILLKMCGKLSHLTLGDVFQGLAGELTSIVLWGRTGREGSRTIQMWLGGYLLILYTSFLGLVLAFPSGDILGMGPYHYDIPVELVIYLLACGWLGYLLFTYQVYLFGR